MADTTVSNPVISLDYVGGQADLIVVTMLMTFSYVVILLEFNFNHMIFDMGNEYCLVD